MNCYPLWLPPNVITLVGLAVNVIAVLILAYYNPDGRGLVRFIYFFCCRKWTEQARRLHAGYMLYADVRCSPIRHSTLPMGNRHAARAAHRLLESSLIMDVTLHRKVRFFLTVVVDSRGNFSPTVFVCLSLCLSLSLGHFEGIIVLAFTYAIVTFYTAHWTTYCTGTLRFERCTLFNGSYSITCLLRAGSTSPRHKWLSWRFALRRRSSDRISG